MGKLDGQVAIVTGAAQGIGAAYAQALSDHGASVVLTDILDANPVAEQIRKSNGRAIALKTDVTSTESVREAIKATMDEFEGIDILVNNAALFANLSLKPFEDIPEEEWDKVMDVNIKGLFLCSREVLPAMRSRGRGKIINISSGTVVNGAAMMLHYVTSKAAVLGFTRSLARELGASNICVNALSPGLTSSEGVEAHPAYAEEVRSAIAQMRCIKREQEPEDLLGALIFLASSDSDFMTGQNMLVDGGHYMY